MNILFNKVETREIFSSFWNKNPALFLGLFLLLGAAIAFRPHPILLLPLIGLCASSPSKRTLLAGLLCFALSLAMTTYRHPKIVLPQEKIEGVGIFHIEHVKNYSSPFNRSILYQGTLKHFTSKEGTVFNQLPCSIYLPLYGKKFPANTDYEICGTLCQKGDFAFVLKPGKQTPWTPIRSVFNFSQWRYDTKQAILAYFKTHISDPNARNFLHALTTGEIDERILKMEFGKVGLQHILAISGFHFAFAALFLHFLLRALFPRKIGFVLLILSLSFYYLFLGNTPSIQRGYLAIVLIAASHLFSLRISGLNALGVGLIFELLCNPLNVLHLGFQLTFLCTAAILLFYPIFKRLTTLLLPKRNLEDVKAMPLLDRHGYLLTSLLRNTLALNLAVHLISIPVILHLFHKFPLLSFAYNLFFPVCTCVVMILLFTALLLSPLMPFLSHAIHGWNNDLVCCILNLTTNPPASLDFVIRSKEISFSFVICFVALCFFAGIFFHKSSDNKTPV